MSRESLACVIPTCRSIGMTLAAVLAAALLASAAGAQERPPRRQETIEIRGQVPTPQVVTVRPRELPGFDRRVLVPAFYDRDFWPSILPAIQILPARPVAPRDTTTGTRLPAAPAAPGDTARPPAAAPPRPPSTAAPGPGTAPALSGPQ